jgi:Bacterial regulatory proteins, lacI family
MRETRDRGVLASTECIQKLKEAQARQRNAEGKVWTLTDIAIESGVDAKTVSRFLNNV